MNLVSTSDGAGSDGAGNGRHLGHCGTIVKSVS